jgi:hypothetical protein
VQLYALDILALDGKDLRRLPLSMRKTNLARLLVRSPDGIFVAPFEQGELLLRCGDLGRVEGGHDLLRESIQVFQLEEILSCARTHRVKFDEKGPERGCANLLIGKEIN